MNREDIIQNEIFTDVNFGAADEWVKVKIKNAMDIYAKQECIEFANFIIDNSYTKSEKGWYRYFVQRQDFPAGFSMPTHVHDFKTIDEIYSLFLEQYKKK